MTIKKDALFTGYSRNCLFSVDGLWFLKIEEDADFAKALELAMAVWTEAPEIQARTIQDLLKPGKGIEALQRALDFKHRAELYRGLKHHHVHKKASPLTCKAAHGYSI